VASASEATQQMRLKKEKKGPLLWAKWFLKSDNYSLPQALKQTIILACFFLTAPLFRHEYMQYISW